MAKCLDYLILLLLVVTECTAFASAGGLGDRPTCNVDRSSSYGNQQHLIQPGLAKNRKFSLFGSYTSTKPQCANETIEVTDEDYRYVRGRATCKKGSQRPGNQQILTQPVKTLPVSDGLLHLYALPVGQGNSLVLQCPDGDIAIIDLGSVSSEKHGFWSTGEIKAFLHGHNDKIKNIVITHNDTDHYSFFKKVFPASKDLEFLENIYISCTFDAMPDNHIIRNWIIDIGAIKKIREFSKGGRCGHSKKELCKSITLCPQQPEIIADVLSANAGGCGNKPKQNPYKTPRKITNQQTKNKQKTNTPKTITHKAIQKQPKKQKTNQQKAIQQKEVKENSNIDSIVIGIKYNTFIMHLNGDFEDHSENQNENGPQQKMVDVYGDELQSTVYMLSHHGADCCANKPVMLDAVRPKAVFASSDPFREGYRHPRCSITDYLIKEGYLCKPMNDSSCGQHPMENTINLGDTLQQTFTCGLDPPKGTTDEYLLRRTVSNNQFAIYSTTPSEDKVNLVHLVTNGTTWGFINDIQPRFIR